jgi:hypothetical protein
MLALQKSTQALEDELKKLPQVDIPVRDLFFGGLYTRAICIPAGTALTGVVHKRDFVNIVFGDIAVTTDEGIVRLQGFNLLPGTAGHKRAGYAIEDTIWVNVDHAEEADDMLSEVSFETFKDYEAWRTALKAGQ